MWDNIAAKEQAEAPEGMITGFISKQVKSRPIIYNRKVKGRIELAGGPIYQEVRRRGKRVIRDLHKAPEGWDTCEGGVARGMISTHNTEGGDENSDMEADLERQE
eukprot:5082442-Pleurochrysis_carterae.AAC.1